jgi:hypothetical protein
VHVIDVFDNLPDDERALVAEFEQALASNMNEAVTMLPDNWRSIA